jgi:hypothetical protein
LTAASERSWERLAEFAVAGEDAVAAGLERVVIEQEHRAVGIAVEAAEFAEDEALGHRLVACVAQGRLRPLDPHQVARTRRELEAAADPHRRVGIRNP